ncbi:MAG TPA: response regulator, partial [Polyangiales bacterium]
SRLLSQRQFVVREAASARTGLELLGQQEHDLVLLDLTMPEMDGLEVASRMRAAGSGVPIILCSGNLDAETRAALESGLVQALLHKPFSSDDLLLAIAHTLA